MEEAEVASIFKALFARFDLAFRVARFFLTQHTKMGKIYQITTKCTKWQYNTQTGLKNSKWQ
jgi:hypothetical protein